MANIAAFRGLVYSPRLEASDLLAPPYDAIDNATRAALASKHERNCVHLSAPQAEGTRTEDRFQHAAATFRSWVADGTLVRDDRPSMYRYHQTFSSAELGGQTVTRRGFIAAVRLHAFEDRVIVPHAPTREQPKAEHLALIDACGAHLSPVFTMYSDPSGETDRLFARAEHTRPVLLGTTDDGTVHTLWRVDNRETIGRLQRLLAPMKLYIVDGHHRYAAMLSLRERFRKRAEGELAHRASVQFGIMFLANMSDPGLAALPTHRMIHSLDGFAPEELLEAATEYFDITTVPDGALNAQKLRIAIAEAASKRPSFGAVWPFHDDAALFSLKDSVNLSAAGLTGHPALTNLDVSVLHGLVFENLLGLDRAVKGAQTHIRYISDTRTALEETADCNGQICFILNPTRAEQVKAVADAQEFMPNESTFFYPRIANGVVFNPISLDGEID